MGCARARLFAAQAKGSSKTRVMEKEIWDDDECSRAVPNSLRFGFFSLSLFGLKTVPNQLPDPTSPSVTPPAGAGCAPSVAADH